MERRDVLKMVGCGGAVLLTGPALAVSPEAKPFGGATFADAIARVGRDAQGRLGVAVHDLATGERFAHRGDERFPMCSTFKFLLSAAVLHAADTRRLRLDHAAAIPRTRLPANSPAVAAHVGGRMTVAELCKATMTQSDNAAANLLLPMIGGVDGFNIFARRLGDTTTRLDRVEPMLNTAVHGDLRDTTTPGAMLASMHAALFGSRLTPAARTRLVGWLIANTTGGTRLRAGLPRGWQVGDKTGTGEHGSANDIGIIWPARVRRPILVTSYLTGARVPQAARYAAHAAVGRAIATAVG